MTYMLKRSELIKNMFVAIAMYAVTMLVLWENVWIPVLDFDEGVHINIARLIEAGYKPYTEIFVGYPPVFVFIDYWAWHFGHTIINTRLVFALFNGLLVVVTVGIAGRLFGKREAFISFLLLVTSATFLERSVSIMADTPATMFGTLSVLLVIIAHGKHRKWWLWAAGISFGLGMLTKFLIPHITIVLLSFIIFRNINISNRRLFFESVVIDGIVFGAGIIVVLLLVFSFVDAKAVFDSTVLFRLQVRQKFPPSNLFNLHIIIDFLRIHLPVVIGIVGAAVLFKRMPQNRRGSGRLLWEWFILGCLWLQIQKPLRSQHMVVLLPPFVLLAAYGYGLMMDLLSDLTPKSVRWNNLVATLLVGAVICGWQYAKIYPIIINFVDRSTATLQKTDGDVQGRQKTIKRIKLITSPLDCVIADDPIFLIDLDRLPPPALVEPSFAIIASQYLTAQKFKDIVEQYDCQAIVSTNKRFKKLPDIFDWLRQQYLFVNEADVKMYAVKKNTQQPPSVSLETQFENGVRLLGVDIGVQPSSDDERYVSFYWQLGRNVTDSYKVFIQLRDANNKMVLSLDRFTFNNEIPVQKWPINTTIKDTNWFTLPADLLPGEYNFFVGLYDPITGVRIPILNDVSGENAVEIGPLMVQ